MSPGLRTSGYPFARLGRGTWASQGYAGDLSFVPGAPLEENLQRFGVYTLLTSTGSWDLGRAITNTLALAVLGPGVLTTLPGVERRAVVVPD